MLVKAAQEPAVLHADYGPNYLGLARAGRLTVFVKQVVR
jgi:hypothetical protein